MIDKVLCYDIETIRCMFLVCVYDPIEDKTYDFEVSRRKNQLDSLIKFIDTHEDYYYISFNGLHFDSQVIEWIIRNHEQWIDTPVDEIVGLIYQKAQDVIDDGNYGVLPQYREEYLSFKQIDLFTISGYENLNLRTSLKSLEFSMCLENIEEMPIDHWMKEMTDDQMDDVIKYCHNDVFATYQFYKITIGKTEMSLYKGKNKIEDRLIMEQEFGLKCLNWSDVKIGAEWNKLDYLKMSRKLEKDIKPKQIITFYGKPFKKFFPKWISYQTPELKKFVKEFGNTYALAQQQEFKFTFPNKLIVTIAKGGAHSNEVGRFLQPKEDEKYISCDIGSQYPNAIRKYKVEPSHLPGWNSLIVSKIDRRLKYKKLGKATGDPKYNSMQEMGKLSLNGGCFGRLNSKGDFQEYPYGMLQVTIGGQMEILMIVEDLVLKGFNVVSINTDGWDTIISISREEEFKAILTEWEKIIGNDILGNFEYTEFKWIAQTSVNDYLALKLDGTTKEKGDFEIDKLLHKNSSMRIIPITLKEYFVNNIPVEETIKNHTNIYDFCIRKKASRDFHYEGTILSTGEKHIYNKLIRYYVSNHGEKVYKIKNPSCTTNAAAKSQVEAGEWVMTICNYLPKTTQVKDADINFSYYIEKANNIIFKVEFQGKKRNNKTVANQLSLF
jgi:hypothetical protein